MEHVDRLVHRHHVAGAQDGGVREVVRSFEQARNFAAYAPLQVAGGIEGAAAAPGQGLGPELLSCNCACTVVRRYQARRAALPGCQTIKVWQTLYIVLYVA